MKDKRRKTLPKRNVAKQGAIREKERGEDIFRNFKTEESRISKTLQKLQSDGEAIKKGLDPITGKKLTQSSFSTNLQSYESRVLHYRQNLRDNPQLNRIAELQNLSTYSSKVNELIKNNNELRDEITKQYSEIRLINSIPDQKENVIESQTEFHQVPEDKEAQHNEEKETTQIEEPLVEEPVNEHSAEEVAQSKEPEGSEKSNDVSAEVPEEQSPSLTQETEMHPIKTTEEELPSESPKIDEEDTKSPMSKLLLQQEEKRLKQKQKQKQATSSTVSSTKAPRDPVRSAIDKGENIKDELKKVGQDRKKLGQFFVKYKEYLDAAQRQIRMTHEGVNQHLTNKLSNQFDEIVGLVDEFNQKGIAEGWIEAQDKTYRIKGEKSQSEKTETEWAESTISESSKEPQGGQEQQEQSERRATEEFPKEQHYGAAQGIEEKSAEGSQNKEDKDLVYKDLAKKYLEDVTDKLLENADLKSKEDKDLVYKDLAKEYLEDITNKLLENADLNFREKEKINTLKKEATDIVTNNIEDGKLRVGATKELEEIIEGPLKSENPEVRKLASSFLGWVTNLFGIRSKQSFETTSEIKQKPQKKDESYLEGMLGVEEHEGGNQENQAVEEQKEVQKAHEVPKETEHHEMPGLGEKNDENKKLSQAFEKLGGLLKEEPANLKPKETGVLNKLFNVITSFFSSPQSPIESPAIQELDGIGLHHHDDLLMVENQEKFNEMFAEGKGFRGIFEDIKENGLGSAPAKLFENIGKFADLLFRLRERSSTKGINDMSKLEALEKELLDFKVNMIGGYLEIIEKNSELPDKSQMLEEVIEEIHTMKNNTSPEKLDERDFKSLAEKASTLQTAMAKENVKESEVPSSDLSRGDRFTKDAERLDASKEIRPNESAERVVPSVSGTEETRNPIKGDKEDIRSQKDAQNVDVSEIAHKEKEKEDVLTLMQVPPGFYNDFINLRTSYLGEYGDEQESSELNRNIADAYSNLEESVRLASSLNEEELKNFASSDLPKDLEIPKLTYEDKQDLVTQLSGFLEEFVANDLQKIPEYSGLPNKEKEEAQGLVHNLSETVKNELNKTMSLQSFVQKEDKDINISPDLSRKRSKSVGTVAEKSTQEKVNKEIQDAANVSKSKNNKRTIANFVLKSVAGFFGKLSESIKKFSKNKSLIKVVNHQTKQLLQIEKQIKKQMKKSPTAVSFEEINAFQTTLSSLPKYNKFFGENYKKFNQLQQATSAIKLDAVEKKLGAFEKNTNIGKDSLFMLENLGEEINHMHSDPLLDKPHLQSLAQRSSELIQKVMQQPIADKVIEGSSDEMQKHMEGAANAQKHPLDEQPSIINKDIEGLHDAREKSIEKEPVNAPEHLTKEQKDKKIQEITANLRELSKQMGTVEMAAEWLKNNSDISEELLKEAQRFIPTEEERIGQSSRSDRIKEFIGVINKAQEGASENEKSFLAEVKTIAKESIKNNKLNIYEELEDLTNLKNIQGAEFKELIRFTQEQAKKFLEDLFVPHPIFEDKGSEIPKYEHAQNQETGIKEKIEQLQKTRSEIEKTIAAYKAITPTREKLQKLQADFDLYLRNLNSLTTNFDVAISLKNELYMQLIEIESQLVGLNESILHSESIAARVKASTPAWINASRKEKDNFIQRVQQVKETGKEIEKKLKSEYAEIDKKLKSEYASDRAKMILEFGSYSNEVNNLRKNPLAKMIEQDIKEIGRFHDELKAQADELGKKRLPKAAELQNKEIKQEERYKVQDLPRTLTQEEITNLLEKIKEEGTQIENKIKSVSSNAEYIDALKNFKRYSEDLQWLRKPSEIAFVDFKKTDRSLIKEIKNQHADMEGLLEIAEEKQRAMSALKDQFKMKDSSENIEPADAFLASLTLKLAEAKAKLKKGEEQQEKEPQKKEELSKTQPVGNQQDIKGKFKKIIQGDEEEAPTSSIKPKGR